MGNGHTAREAGFSLVELLVAMTVTLIISGAIYALLTGGQGAFRVQPQLTERQQNIRIAMDIIMRDLTTAGTDMGPFFPVFTDALDADGLSSPAAGVNTDYLEIFGKSGLCPDAPVEGANGNNLNALTGAPIPACYPDGSLLLVFYKNGAARYGLGHNVHAQDGKVNFPSGKQPPGSTLPGTPPNCLEDYDCDKTPIDNPPLRFAVADVYRYQIAPDTDGVPSLWRSETGGINRANGTFSNPDAQNPTPAWQILARGIEDLQVQYRRGDGAWSITPGPQDCVENCASPTTNDYNRIVREVRVTLGARALETRLVAGATDSAAGRAIRGQLTQASVVRSALLYLSTRPNPPLWQ